MQYFCDFSFFYHQQYTCNWHAKSYFNGNDNFPIDYYVIHIHSNWFFFNFIVVGSLWEQLHVITYVSPASDRRSRSYPANWPWQGWNFENSECRVTGQVRICESDSCGPEFCDSVWLCKWDEGHSIPHCAGESRVMTERGKLPGVSYCEIIILMSFLVREDIIHHRTGKKQPCTISTSIPLVVLGHLLLSHFSNCWVNLQCVTLFHKVTFIHHYWYR